MKPMAHDDIIIPPLVSKKAIGPVLITLKCETSNTIELNCGINESHYCGIQSHVTVTVSYKHTTAVALCVIVVHQVLFGSHKKDWMSTATQNMAGKRAAPRLLNHTPSYSFFDEEQEERDRDAERKRRQRARESAAETSYRHEANALRQTEARARESAAETSSRSCTL